MERPVTFTPTTKRLPSRGVFWVPGSHRRIRGELSKAEDGGFKIELDGALHSKATADTWSVIFGTLRDGRAVTLVDTYQITEKIPFSGETTTELLAKQLVLDGHWRAGMRQRANLYIMFFSGFERFVGMNPFDFSEKLAARVREYTPKTGTIRSGLSFEIAREVSRSLSWEKVELGARYGVLFRGRSRALEEWNQIGQCFRALLTILCGDVPAVTQVSARQSSGGDVVIDTDLVHKGETISIAPPFSLHHIGPTFASHVVKWFRQWPRIELLAMSFVAQRNRGLRFPEFELLAWTQALEGFHRHLMGGRYVPDEEYEHIRTSLYAAIPARTPESLKASLKSRIKYGNEFALRKRLLDLIESLPEAVRVPLQMTRPSVFVANVVDCRNEYTHRDPSAVSSPLRGRALLRLNRHLCLFAQALLLAQCDVPADVVARQLPTTKAFREFQLWSQSDGGTAR